MAEVEITGITEAELLQALENALVADDNPEGALTTGELSELTGWHLHTVRKALKALKALKVAGCLRTVKVYREDLAGRYTKVPAYRLKASHN